MAVHIFGLLCLHFSNVNDNLIYSPEKRNEKKTHSTLCIWRSKCDRERERRNGENQTENLVQRLCQHIKAFISAKSVEASMNLMLKIENVQCKVQK